MLTGGAIAEHIQLVFLDAVFHVTAGTVKLVVQLLGIAFKVGHHITRIDTVLRVLDLGDHATRTIPAAGSVLEIGEPAHFMSGGGKARRGLILQGCREPVQALILSQSDDVADLVMITPAQHLPAAKATVTAEDDPHLWPHLRQSFDQQRQNRPAVFGTIDVARTKIARQQLMTAEYIQ